METCDFSQTENHGSTFPVGAFYGLKAYIDFQFRTGKNVIAYYDRLAELGLIKLNPENTNMYAYECFWADKPEEAIIIINWAINKFPEDCNLYDSRGEFYETTGDLHSARESYQMAMEKLKNTKKEFDRKSYEEKMGFFKQNFERVK